MRHFRVAWESNLPDAASRLVYCDWLAEHDWVERERQLREEAVTAKKA